MSGSALPRADVDHAEPAEIAVLRAERSVDDLHVLHQFGRQALERTQISLAVALRALVLLDVVHQHLQSAADAAVIQVEAEAPDLHRLAAAFVLARVDAGVQHVENLVVAREQRADEDLGIAAVHRRLHRLGGDHDGGLHGLERGLLLCASRRERSGHE